MNSSKVKVFVIILLLVLLGWLGLNHFSTSSNEHSVELLPADKKITGISDINLPEFRQKLISLIEEKGAQQAYQIFKKEIEPHKKSGFSHIAAHVMGEVIYEKTGTDGVTVCDASFGFGCYHSFFLMTLRERGPVAIEDLDKKCVEEYGKLGTGCQHGLGHGLLGYYGRDNIEQALKACKKTTWVRDLLGCPSGVYMEYNFPTNVQSENKLIARRKLKEDNIYEPCVTQVPKEFKKTCYHEISQWWRSETNNNFQRMGTFCEEIPEPEYKEVCYLGIGTEIGPVTNYNISQGINHCESMPNSKGKMMCLAGTAWSFFQNPKHRQDSPKLCSSLEEEDKINECLEWGDIAGTDSIQKIYQKNTSSSPNKDD